MVQRSSVSFWPSSLSHCAVVRQAPCGARGSLVRGRSSGGFRGPRGNCYTTGKGWVKQHDGCYRDALLNKTTAVAVILHESLGGGFSPPAVAAMHRNSKEARAGLDRTKYSCPRPISYFTHHTQRISKTIVHCDATATLDKIKGAKAKLSNRRGSWRTVGS